MSDRHAKHLHKSDLSLIEETKSGDLEAFRMIIQRYEDKVAGTVKSMLGNTVETDDVGQEVFIRLYEALGKFRGDASLSTYIVRIAINLSLNELKKRKRDLKRFKEIDEAKNVAEPGENDLTEMLQTEISQLPTEFKTVVTLRMIEGYSVEETASILEIPAGTVMSRLARAQKKLKERITSASLL